MALPTSTIAMAVLTCIPFGLAVRDTVRQRTAAQTERERIEQRARFDEQQEALAAERDYARRQAEREREEREQAERAAAMSGLLGDSPTSLGPLFGDIAIGMSGEELYTRSTQLAAITALGFRVHVEGRDHVPSIVLVPRRGSSDDLCDQLSAQLVTRWGRPDAEDDEELFWVTGARRASFWRSATCKLRFERYAPPESWIDRSTDSVVPIAAIGKPAKALAAQLEQRLFVAVSVEDDSVVWSDVGVGTGSGRTSLVANVSGGRVTGILATTRVSTNTQDDIIAQLTALFGPRADDGNWTGKPPVTLDVYDGHLTLTAGKVEE
ncbi:MAG: hypothetical protein H0T89_04625 [Deltaproteobacteria bacterium]|nr:hypothetical protein [Deltaproteobacteria bacterium]MDQ3295417.1 hypothetical protein [Myxococcota bacterium]